jgi:hypothetical protein
LDSPEELRERRERINFVMELFSDALSEGHHEALDWLVSGLDPAEMESSLIVSVLTCAAWPAIPAPDIDGGFVRGLLIGNCPRGDLIPSRHEFARRAQVVLNERIGAERTKNLLRGLVP